MLDGVKGSAPSDLLWIHDEHLDRGANFPAMELETVSRRRRGSANRQDGRLTRPWRLRPSGARVLCQEENHGCWNDAAVDFGSVGIAATTDEITWLSLLARSEVASTPASPD